MSDIHNIQALLKKFWEGETSLEEERQLKSYFASGAIDEQLRQYAPLFQAIREEQAVQLNKPKVIPIRPQQYHWQGWAMAASIALLLAAGAWWLFTTPANSTNLADKTPVKELPETPEKTNSPEKQVVAQAEPKTQVSRVKRSIIKRVKPTKINKEEEEAIAEIKAALALVSSKIRKGRQEAAKGAEHLENIDKIFKRKDG